MRWKKIVLALVLTIAAGNAFLLFRKKTSVPLKEEPKVVSEKELPQDIAKLNHSQQQIANLSDDAIEKELTDLKQTLLANDLIGRLNRNEANEQEKTLAKEMLIRSSLLRVEKNKRLTKAAN